MATFSLGFAHHKRVKALVFGAFVCMLVFGGLFVPAGAKVAKAATCTVQGTIIQIGDPNMQHSFIHRVPLHPSKLNAVKKAYYVNGSIKLDISVWTIFAGVAGSSQNPPYIDFWVWTRYRVYYPFIGNGTKTLVEYTC